MKFFGVVLGLKKAAFTKGLKDAKSELGGFKKDAGGAFGSASGGVGGITSALGGLKNMLAGIAVGAFFKDASKYAADLADQATQIDVPVEKIQAFNAAFADAGVNAEGTSKAFMDMNEQAIDALRGNEKAQQSFEALGVSMSDLAQMADKPDELMLRLSDGMAKAENKGLAVAAMTEILGKAGKKMGGNFGGVADSVRDTAGAFVTLSTEMAKANDEMGTWFDMRWRDLKAAGGTLTGMAWKAAKGVFSPSGWKSNMLGQQGAQQAMNPTTDPLAGLTTYQRGLVEQFGMDPKQAAKMSPGRGEAEMTDREKAEAAQLHESMNQREASNAAQGAAQKNIARNAEAFTQSRKMGLNRIQIDELQNRLARGMSPEDAAPLQTELAGKLQERRGMLRDQNLMSADDRREQRRQERREEQADKKAQRQLAREEKDKERRAKTGAHDEAKDKREKGIKDAADEQSKLIQDLITEARNTNTILDERLVQIPT